MIINSGHFIKVLIFAFLTSNASFHVEPVHRSGTEIILPLKFVTCISTIFFYSYHWIKPYL